MKKVILSAFAIVFLCTFFCGCAGLPKTPPDDTSGFSALAAEAAGLTASGDGEMAEFFDAQAKNLAGGRELFWYPKYTATVVIAVDRDAVKYNITGYADMEKSGAAVSLRKASPYFQYIMAAMSYGMDGDSMSMKRSSQLLHRLYAKKLLRLDKSAPISLCFDYEAAALKKTGRNIDIVVPAEGTLSFEKGILSNRRLSFAAGFDESLIEHGFRLTDGRCDNSLYPASYDGAKPAAKCANAEKAAMESYKVWRRAITHERIFGTATGRGHILSALIFLIIAVFWSGTVITRAMHRDIKRYMLVLAVFTVLWVVLRVFKWLTPGGSELNRYCWYCYYIFEYGIPTVLLLIAYSAGRPEGSGTPRWWRICAAVNALFIAAVLTNDVHGLVFRLSYTGGEWNGDYSYGLLYYIMTAVNLAFVIAAMAVLAKKAGDSPNRSRVFYVAGLLGVILLYGALYVLHVPVAYESDFVVVMSLFTLMFIETALKMRLIPINREYRRLFMASPLDMRIVDGSGKTVYAAKNAGSPADAAGGDPAAPSRRQTDDGIVICSTPVTGGAVIWREDISAITELQKSINAAAESLARGNEVLRREYWVKARAERTETRQAVQAELDKLIEERLSEAAELVRNTGRDGDPGTALAYANLLLCYCKRRSGLMFTEKEYRSLSYGELSACFEELGTYAECCGVQAAFACPLSAELDPAFAAQAYTFVFEGLCACIKMHMKEVICSASVDGGRITLRLLTEEPLAREDFSVKACTSDDGFLSAASISEERGGGENV